MNYKYRYIIVVALYRYFDYRNKYREQLKNDIAICFMLFRYPFYKCIRVYNDNGNIITK